MVSPGLAAAQEVVIPPDSAQSEIRAVLRAFYLHLEHKDWEALSPYVLSPKLLERRGSPGDLQMVTRDRTRGRGSSHAVASPRTCPAKPAALIDEAAIRLDGTGQRCRFPDVTGAHRESMSSACSTSRIGGASSIPISSMAHRALSSEFAQAQ